MKMTELFIAELEREAARSRKTLEQTPDQKHNWKPHARSMNFGYLAELVATMPTWIAMTVRKDEHDIAPADGSSMKRTDLNSSGDLIAAHDKAIADATSALQGTTDAHLMTSWKLLARGKVVMEQPRHIVIREAINHIAHHRGQMTVYLRLLDAKVPAIYGPSADDTSFA